MSANLFPPLHGPPPPPYTGAYATKSLAFGNDTSMTYRSPLAGGQPMLDVDIRVTPGSVDTAFIDAVDVTLPVTRAHYDRLLELWQPSTARMMFHALTLSEGVTANGVVYVSKENVGHPLVATLPAVDMQDFEEGLAMRIAKSEGTVTPVQVEEYRSFFINACDALYALSVFRLRFHLGGMSLTDPVIVRFIRFGLGLIAHGLATRPSNTRVQVQFLVSSSKTAEIRAILNPAITVLDETEGQCHRFLPRWQFMADPNNPNDEIHYKETAVKGSGTFVDLASRLVLQQIIN